MDKNPQDTDSQYENQKLFQTIGELYIVYLQSKKFLSEENLLINHPIIMERVKINHDKLENIFQDLTRLQVYQNVWNLSELSKAYYRASTLNLIFNKVEESEREPFINPFINGIDLPEVLMLMIRLTK